MHIYPHSQGWHVPEPQPKTCGGPGPASPSSLPLPSQILFVPGWGRWGAEARRALMCHFAQRHGSWAQQAGTIRTRARRQLQRHLCLSSQHGAALFLPGKTGTVPSAHPPLGYVPNKACGE